MMELNMTYDGLKFLNQKYKEAGEELKKYYNLDEIGEETGKFYNDK